MNVRNNRDRDPLIVTILMRLIITVCLVWVIGNYILEKYTPNKLEERINKIDNEYKK